MERIVLTLSFARLCERRLHQEILFSLGQLELKITVMISKQRHSRKGQAHVVPRGDGPNASLHTQDRSLGDLSRLQHGVVDVSYSRGQKHHMRSEIKFCGVSVDRPCQDIVTVSLKV
jgi:hypothetical protein